MNEIHRLLVKSMEWQQQQQQQQQPTSGTVSGSPTLSASTESYGSAVSSTISSAASASQRRPATPGSTSLSSAAVKIQARQRGVIGRRLSPTRQNAAEQGNGGSLHHSKKQPPAVALPSEIDARHGQPPPDVMNGLRRLRGLLEVEV